MSNTSEGKGAFTSEELQVAVANAIEKIREKHAGNPDGFARALLEHEHEGLPIRLRGLKFVVKIDNLSRIVERESLQDA